MFSDFLSLAEILCLLIRWSQSSKDSQSVCARTCVWRCLLRTETVEIEEGGAWWWRGPRQQDVNESVLINVCLISYSALSGHGKDGVGGALRDCWVEFMRKCRPNL